jgi:hypothetical protein
MDKLFELLGLALPDTRSIFRLKIIFGGICGLGAGLVYMLSGLDGSLLWGGLMAACGIALLGLAARSFTREAREKEAALLASPQREAEESRQTRERLARQEGCEHHWVRDEQALDYDVWQESCAKCGAVRDPG